MKKNLALSAFILLAVFALVVVPTGITYAIRIDPTDPPPPPTATPTPTTAPIAWNDPVVTGGTGEGEIVGSLEFPGVETLANGMLVPLGTKHELQFGGKGVQVTGLAAGKTAEVCFDFPTARYGWAGAIFQWTGTAWLKMETIIFTDPTNLKTTVCTPHAGNGFYALLVGYDGK